MSVLQICAIGISAAVAVLLLKDAGSPHPEAVVLILGVIVMTRVVLNIGEVVSFIGGISDGTSAAGYVKTLLKAAGLAFITDFTSGICNDAGEGRIAEYIEIAGKAELVVLTLPVVTDLLELSFGMLNV